MESMLKEIYVKTSIMTLGPKTKGLMTLGRLDIPGEFDNLHIIFILS
jgi:hypothetical protein